MKKKIFLILIMIVLLGGGLRFWRLASYPVSLSIDEVSIGYSAYSILKTARDEHGQFLPLAFRSIGDYKPPILIYLMTPAIAILGLNEFGVRFTIALIGTLTIFFVYLLTQELTGKKIIALLTSFSLAISPWHIQFSRASFEAILALIFLIVGVWLFLRSVKQKGKLLWLSALLFALSMYSYHAERVVVPLLVLGLAIIFRRQLWRHRKATFLAIGVGLIVSLPLLNLMLGPKGKTRAMHGFIGRDYEINRELKWTEEFTGWPAAIFNQPALVLLNFWLKRYLDYWDLDFLFFNGMQLGFPGRYGVGLFHLFEIIPFLTGIWLVFFRKSLLENKNRKLLVFWLLVGPLAASLANNPQHPLRSLTTIPAPQILVGLGGFWLFNSLVARRIPKESPKLHRRRSSATTNEESFGFYTERLFLSLKKGTKIKKILAGFATAGIVVLCLVYYLDIYYVHYPIQHSEFWHYGMKQVAQYAWKHQSEYEEIVIDPVFGTKGPDTVSVPYFYVLLYGQYDPSLFQNSPRRRVKTEDSVDFENFTFRSIYWPNDRYRKKTLFIGSPWSLPPEDLSPEQIKEKIYFKNGALGFLIVETD